MFHFQIRGLCMSDKIKVSACVRSGMCCKKAPCPFGEVDVELGYCKFLEFDKDNIAKCLNYDEIIKDPTSNFSPAFGYGCCMSIGNTARIDIIYRDYDGVNPTVEIDSFIK